MTSPSSRTQETWKFAAAAIRTPLKVSEVERLYDATAHTILQVVKGAAPATHTLLIVGHNPGLHELATMLVASGDISARDFVNREEPLTNLLEVMRHLMSHNGHMKTAIIP